MRHRRRASTWLAAAIGIWCAAASAPATSGLPAAAADASTRAGRLAAIHHAQVWKATNVRAMNLRAGPQGRAAFKPQETVACHFVPRPHGRGSTLKLVVLRGDDDLVGTLDVRKVD